VWRSFLAGLLLIAGGVSAAVAEEAVAEEAVVEDAAAGDRPPVLLRKTLLLPPVEAAGTGLAPEVKVTAEVDERGRVTAVAVRGIEPSSELDPAFTDTAVSAIERWRYAPAVVDGQPAATTLEWTIQFKERPAASARQRGDGWLGFGLTAAAYRDPEWRRARLLSLPLEQRKKLLAEQAEKAEKHLDRKRRRRVESPRFVLVTDAAEEKVDDVLLGNLEATWNVLARLFGDPIPLQPEPLKIVVYFYESRASYAGLRSELETFEWAQGMYHPAGFLAFHRQMPSSEALTSMMLHEVTHAFFDRRLLRPGHRSPPWLTEGFAEYVGNSEIRKGELIPGKTRKARIELSLWGPVRLKTDAWCEVGDVKKSIRRGEGLSPERLITADRESFYSEDPFLYYPTAWLLVHFLRHGEPGWADDEFPRFLMYAVEGYPPAELLEPIYGFGAEELDRRFRDYVLKEL
jgi:TonB family protein